MSDQGVFQVHRGIFDHPIFAPEPFTEREAWLWMIATAAWKATRVRFGRKMIALERGQLIFSERFLAEKWQWAKTTVRRFLARLCEGNMITQKTDRDATLITICNYDEYQFGGTTERTTGGPLADHSRTKEEELKHLRKEDFISEDRASGFTEGSKKLASAFWKALGFPTPLEIPPQYAGTDWRALEWERAGWTEDIIAATVARIGPGKPTSYYEKAFASDFAKLQAPLPVVEVKQAETITVTHGRIQKTESLSHVARRHAESGISFGERPSTPDLCVVPSSADVRLLPKGGGERPGDLRGGDGIGPKRIPGGGD